MFGAAAAAACGAGLDAQQMRWVLDYTAQQSSGIAAWQRDTDHIEKAFVFGGMSARNGVTAAHLVQLGWTGVDDVFSGADNFFQAYAPAGDPAMLVEQLGERYEITRTDIKKWTVGSPIQAPLDAIEILRKRHPFEVRDVERLVVRLAPTVADVVDNRDIPDICLQHMVAVMLIDKTASFKAAHDKPRMQDAAVLRERAKIQLVRDEPLQQFMPVRVAIVEIVLADGTRLTERVDAVRGTPRNPMSRAEVIDKARDLIAPVLGGSTTTRLIETVYSLDTVAERSRAAPAAAAAVKSGGWGLGAGGWNKTPAFFQSPVAQTPGPTWNGLLVDLSPGAPSHRCLAARPHVLVEPPVNHVGDLQVLLVQHHHVGHAQDPHVVQLQIVGLRRSLLGRAPGVDGVDGVRADHARPRVVALQRHVRDVVEVRGGESAVGQRARSFERAPVPSANPGGPAPSGCGSCDAP